MNKEKFVVQVRLIPISTHATQIRQQLFVIARTSNEEAALDIQAETQSALMCLESGKGGITFYKLVSDEGISKETTAETFNSAVKTEVTLRAATLDHFMIETFVRELR